MPDRWWNEFPKPKPRRPAPDGIKARSRRGDIGATWWSRRFLEALEAITDPNRLRRGRSYARTGQVMDLRVDAGRVSARVQGSRARPYDVTIRVPPLAPADWKRVEDAMAAQAVFMARLLAGEMPADIEQAFTAAGVSLFPARPRELDTACSCPDAANPCKHVAATLYILAEAFDDDPFLIFAWRGRPRAELIERLRARRLDAAPAGAAPAGAAGDDTPATVPTAPLPLASAEFWAAGLALADLHLAPFAPDHPDAILLQLGPPPLPTRGRPLADALAAAYRTIAAAAEKRAFGKGG